MSPKPTTCHRWGKVFADLFYKSYVCVLELVTDHQAQAAAVLQTPDIVLSHAGHPFRSTQAYAICFFFSMVKTCSKWSLEVLPRIPGASALRCPGAAARAARARTSPSHHPPTGFGLWVSVRTHGGAGPEHFTWDPSLLGVRVLAEPRQTHPRETPFALGAAELQQKS